MALEIFKLFGSIFVDNEKANESISKTDTKAQGVGKTLLKGVGTAAKWGAGLAAGAAAGATALVGVATKTASVADNIDKMSQKIGISRTAYQELDFVMSQSGASVDSLKAGIKTLTGQMDMAQSGSETAIKAFEDLGLSWEDGNGKLKDQETMMFEAMTALQNMEDQTKKAALATDLFGKAGTEMMPMLNGAAGSIEAMRQQAHDMGLVMSDEAVDGGVKLTDTIDQLKRSFGAMGAGLGSAVMPIVQQFADLLIANLPMIQGMIEKLAPVFVGLLEGLLPPLFELAETLFPTIITLIETLMPTITQIIENVLPIFTELLGMLLPPLMQIIEALLPPLLSIIEALLPVFGTVIELLKPIIDLFIQLLAPILDLITKAIAPLMEKFAGLINTILKPLVPVIKEVAKILGDVLGDAFEALAPYIDNVIGYFQGLIDFITGVFTGDWELAFEGLKKIVKNIFEGMANLVKIPINAIIKGINSFIGGLNKLKIPDWVPGVGGKGFHINEIPMLANGGEIEQAGRVLVGENGPEYLDLPRGAKVIPLDKAAKKAKEIILYVYLTIENFYNNSEDDIEKLSDDLAFITKRKLEGGGKYELDPV